VTTTQLRLLQKQSCAGPRAKPSRGRIPVRVSKAGIEPAFPMARSIRNLHHQRRFSRTRAANLIANEFSRRSAAPLSRTPKRLALPSVSGFRLVPSDRPRALGHAPVRREPRDPGLPFRLAPGCFE
jgi:hypothetical protein